MDDQIIWITELSPDNPSSEPCLGKVSWDESCHKAVQASWAGKGVPGRNLQSGPGSRKAVLGGLGWERCPGTKALGQTGLAEAGGH